MTGAPSARSASGPSGAAASRRRRLSAEDVLHHGAEDAPQRLALLAVPVEAGPGRLHRLEGGAHQRQRPRLLLGEQPGAQPVVDIVIVVGDVVRQRRDLRLRRRVLVQVEREDGVDLRHPERQPAAVGAGRRQQRAVMLGDALQRLPGQVQPVEGGVAPLQHGHDPQGLRVVVEAAIIGHAGRKRVLAGVAEGRVAEIVRQRHRLGEILVERQRPRQRARHLTDLDRVGQPRAVIVSLMLHEDLRLVLEPAEGAAMDDPVAVALEGRAMRAFGFGVASAAALRGVAGEGGEGGTARHLGGRGSGA
jgi:hypothetical protein